MRIVRALEAFYRACPRLSLCLAGAAVLSGLLLPGFMLASGALVLLGGDIVVFSSLTPHLTGPNTTEQVRKAYILQYAPAGAHALSGAHEGPPTARTPCDHPHRQFPVVRDGRRVPPPPVAGPASP